MLAGKMTDQWEGVFDLYYNFSICFSLRQIFKYSKNTKIDIFRGWKTWEIYVGRGPIQIFANISSKILKLWPI